MAYTVLYIAASKDGFIADKQGTGLLSSAIITSP